MSKIIEAKQKLQDSKSKNTAMNLVIDYVIGFIQDDMFAEKILSEKKSVAEMWQFVMTEARKQAINNSALVSDDEVYNWAVHYFDEESVEISKTVAAQVVKVPSKIEITKEKVKANKEKIKKLDGEQLLMTLDLFGDESEQVESDDDYEDEYEEE